MADTEVWHGMAEDPCEVCSGTIRSAAGRARCDSCGAMLTPTEVPVGTCYTCRQSAVR